MNTKEESVIPLLEESSKPGAAPLEHVGIAGSNWPAGESVMVSCTRRTESAKRIGDLPRGQSSERM